MRENLRGHLLLEFNNKFLVLNKITHLFTFKYLKKLHVENLEKSPSLFIACLDRGGRRGSRRESGGD